MSMRRRPCLARWLSALRRWRRIRLRLSISLRLALGFLLAALLAAVTTGVIDLQRLDVLHAQAHVYQTLLQTTATLTTENDSLKSIEIQTSTLLADASEPRSVPKTLTQDERALEAFLQQYHELLLTSITHDLLAQHPEQVALLANGPVLVEQQRTYAAGAWRTWSVYEQTERHILQTVQARHVGDGQALAHLQGEPEFQDALSALHSLIQFNEQLASSVDGANGAPAQSLATSFGALLVFLAILLVGFLISRSLIVRLTALHRVTQEVRQGQMSARVPVRGQDEITDVARSVNTMLDSLVAALQQETIAKKQTDLAYARQRQLTEMKDQFIRHMSHELRTPLTGVYGFLQLLRDYQDADSAQQQVFVNQAMKGCEELIELCSSILDASNHATMRAPQRLPLVLIELVEDLLAQQRPQEQAEHPIVLALPAALTIQADPQYVRQVLRNLLSNAYKYTPAHQAIYLETFTPDPAPGTGEQGELVGICVRDTGPGIPLEEQDLLFQPFVRLKRDLTGPIRGTGLGLSLCKQFVEAMGGRIWVESTGIPGAGSRFCFTLPLARASADDACAVTSSGKTAERAEECAMKA